MAFLGGYALIVGLAWWFPAQAWRVTAFGFSGLWLAFALTLLSRGGLLGRCNVLRFARAACADRAAALPHLRPSRAVLPGSMPASYCSYRRWCW